MLEIWGFIIPPLHYANTLPHEVKTTKFPQGLDLLPNMSNDQPSPVIPQGKFLLATAAPIHGYGLVQVEY